MKTLPPFEPLTPSQIAPILDKVSLATVAVLGDFCLDVYWQIDRSASEKSVETGLATEPVRSQRYAAGGAGNVVANLLSLGVRRVIPIGVLGDDPFGRELNRILRGLGADTEGLIVQREKWATHTYVKPHAQERELNRLDHGNFNQLSMESEAFLFLRLEQALSEAAVVVVNHQTLGSFHDSPSFRQRLGGVMRKNAKTCFIIDSRKYHEAYGPAMHKLNEREVMRACGHAIEEGEAVPFRVLEPAIRELHARWKFPFVITRGERGCVVCHGDAIQETFGVLLTGKTDAVGAGDTFVSALAGLTAAGEDFDVAAFVANLAAAVTTQKLFQTSAASPSEILDLARTADFVCRPELAEAPSQARFFSGTEIEIITEKPCSPAIECAIFDHDGTLSVLRQGWENIMEPMMLCAILGEQRKTLPAHVVAGVQAEVRAFIDRTTGIQTLAQMNGLCALVREYGYVPEENMLDEDGYKKIYNQDLMNMAQTRARQISQGEKSPLDFQVKGCRAFLELAHAAGVRLYLVSGTDEADVKAEAEIMGYAHLFKGHIYGATGDLRVEAKRVLLERLIQGDGVAPSRLLVAGDGPVEMREGHKRGAFCLGVASDELRREGLNLTKRSRLIRAGADYIVADFSQLSSLRQLLGF